ncbi:hypothetical protein [Curtobacterium phage Parvaparticeps]|nr:hypothetical protein [Curtobacterium phage Parvaparticeps]
MDEPEDSGRPPITERAIEARARVEEAIQNWLNVAAEDSGDPDREGSTVLAWVVGVEWGTMDFMDQNMGARDVFAPLSQTLSASKGLGMYITERY